MQNDLSKKLRATLGANVRAERKRRGLTQEGLAEQLDITPRYLAAIERGERNLTLDSIEALAAQLGVDPHSLLAPGSRP
ncbi:helix-turn-helix domain-containing protein [Arcanobacterium canis]